MTGFRLAVAFMAGICAQSQMRAHDEDLPPRQAKAIKEAVEVAAGCEKQGTLSADQLRRASVLLEVVPTEQLHHVVDYKGPENQAGSGQAGGGKEWRKRVIRSVEYLRAFGEGLSKPADVAALLGSNEPIEVGQALGLLCAEPFGEGFRRVVIALSRDQRSEIRLAAGILAKYGSLMGDPDPGLRVVAANLLVDEDPVVAARFGGEHCMDFGDPELVGKVVGRLSDKRPLPKEWAEVFFSKSVSGAMLYGLRDYVSRWDLSSKVAADAGAVPVPEGQDPEVIAAWWKKTGKLFVDLPKLAGWQPVYDGTVELAVGEATDLKGAKRPVKLRLNSFSVKAVDWAPELSVKIDVIDEQDFGGVAFNIGTPDQFFGWVAETKTQFYKARMLVAPGGSKAARVRLWLWNKQE